MTSTGSRQCPAYRGLTPKRWIVESKRKRGVGATRLPAKLGLAGCQPAGHTGNTQAMAPLRDGLKVSSGFSSVKCARIPATENAPCLSTLLTAH